MRAGNERYKVETKKKKAKGGGVFPKRIPYAILVLLMGIAAGALFYAMILVDIFPRDLTFMIVGLVMGLLIVTSIMLARRSRILRILGIIIGAAFVVVLASVTYYMGTTYATMNKISEIANTSNAEFGTSDADIDPTQEPFNLYITGIDRWAGEQDLDRSDVNMIMTINPVTKKILLTSIPRDTYVMLHTYQEMDKLTHTGIYGVDETINTVEDWLGIDIQYYLKLNFSSMRAIINAIGGIDVYSPVAFDSDISEYSYVQGWNHLNGKQALYFARERHAFEGQDSVRVENQQRVVKAVIKKLTSSTTLLTKYGEIMEVAGSNLSTNMSYEEMQQLIKMQMTDLASWDVSTQKIEGEYDMDYVASLSHKNKYSIYRPDSESVQKCLDGMYAIMHPTVDELEKAKETKRNGFISSIIRNARERVQKGSNADETDETEEEG